ncbi:MAG: hypothetical protein LBJ02_10245 [Bifidobacteriaceae bacterium]|nr:hypothetical protein [Bifidobacteriaceae bacterium]
MAAGTWTLLTAMLLLVFLSGCGEEAPQCRYSDEDPVTALEDFLAKAAAGDQAGATEILGDGWEMDEEAFAALTAQLDGVDLATLRFSPDQLGSMFHYKVMDQDTLIGEFDVITGDGCADVSWGELTETEAGDPAASQSAAP